MIVKFKNSYLQKLLEDDEVTGKPKFEKAVIIKFQKTIQKLEFAESLNEIKVQKGLNFEGLKGKLKDFFQ